MKKEIRISIETDKEELVEFQTPRDLYDRTKKENHKRVIAVIYKKWT